MKNGQIAELCSYQYYPSLYNTLISTDLTLLRLYGIGLNGCKFLQTIHGSLILELRARVEALIY
jgi:hypothetical protein